LLILIPLISPNSSKGGVIFSCTMVFLFIILSNMAMDVLNIYCLRHYQYLFVTQMCPEHT